ncbi:MAG: LamG domain-containing protein [Planctomycetes bacterium]|nr:LamG domain-containing protein [Planctomycetota bacterium]
MCRRLICLTSIVLVLGCIITNTTLAENIGWWKFDEGSGSTAFDTSGNDHHADILGTPEWVVGPPGFSGALDFTNSRGANAGNFDPTGGTGVFSIAFWCRWDGTGGIQHFLTKSNGWNIDTMMFQVEVKGGHSNPDRVNRFHLACQGHPQAVLHVVPANEWAHMVMVFDGTNATGYLNGIDETGPQPTGIGAPLDCPVWIGVAFNDARVFQGMIDDMRLYDRVLDENEIISIMSGGTGQNQSAYGPEPADNALLTETWVNLSWKPGPSAVSHDIYIGDNFDDVNDGAEGTFVGNEAGTFIVVGFPGFAVPDGLVPGTTYYWRIDEVNDADPNSPWKGKVWNFAIAPKTAYEPVPANGADSVETDVKLSWTGGFGSKLHTVYFGDNLDEVSNAAGGQTQGGTDYTPGPLEMAKTYYWRVDEFDVTDTHKGDIWSFTTVGAVSGPAPANAAVDVTQTPVLTWAPGVFADTHEVYFGADAASLELKGSGNLGSESFEPGQLEWNTTYYWRVNEANNTNADSPWTGPLWSFTTANFLIIEDFEPYNDIDEGEPGSNRIYLAWIDGFDNPAANGSVVGNFDPPFAEQTIVHSGNQSMPMAYDNAVGKSEATYVLTSNKDWTVNGVTTLTIWFRGASANTAESLYVALNGGTPVPNDDPDAATRTAWTQWNIDLQAFGTNLANVNSITLGLSSVTGGTGIMYFDDIRLYALSP